MVASHQSAQRYRKQCAVVGLALLISAFAYYLIFRNFLSLTALTVPLDMTAGTYPSFAFCLSASLFCIAILWPSRTHVYWGMMGVLAMTLTLEALMGTFAWSDVIAAILGTSIALSNFKVVVADDANSSSALIEYKKNHRLNTRIVFLWIASFSLAAGSYYGPDCAVYEGNTCVEFKTFKTPVYMSYADLRSSVRMGPIRELSAVNRIYLYKSLILINERNEGIHIIDNRFPASPQQIAFIEIPGNTEISVKDDYLYADSYVDLVTLNLADTDNIVEVAREQDIFPYDAFQNIPYNVDFDFGVVDSSNGVVVGYK